MTYTSIPMLRFITYTIRSALLLLPALLVLSEACYAQTQIVGLRDFKRVWDSNRGDPEGYYFEDRLHDLDKFTGEWEGTGFGDYRWRIHIVVLRKTNYYDSYWSDALGLDLSITKNGKPATTPTGDLIPGTSFIQGSSFRWDREKKSVDPNIYKVHFSHGRADKPYKATVQVFLYMNADQDTIVLRRGFTIAIDEIANTPDYIPPRGYLAEICTLRRLKK